MGSVVGTAIDASVVIAWQNPAHIFHNEATEMIMQADPPLYISELNLAEVLVGIDPTDWETFIAGLTSIGFTISTPTATDIAQARIDSHLRMPDAHVIATARTQGADTILSFDTALVSAANTLGFTTNDLPEN